MAKYAILTVSVHQIAHPAMVRKEIVPVVNYVTTLEYVLIIARHKMEHKEIALLAKYVTRPELVMKVNLFEEQFS